MWRNLYPHTVFSGRSCYVAQAISKIKIFLLQPLKYWNTGMYYHPALLCVKPLIFN